MSPAGRPDRPSRAYTILVVEDDLEIREWMSILLQGEGYATIKAANGCEALDRLRTGQRPGLILLDLWMPLMNGWEFLAAQRQDPAFASIPVVLMTADHSAVTSAAALDSVEVLVKPIDFDRLFGILASRGPNS